MLLFSNVTSAQPMEAKREIVNTYCDAVLSDEMIKGKFFYS